MPVGSHKDAFKAHQLVKRLVDKDKKAELAILAGDILMDFVKNQRQVNVDRLPPDLPADQFQYDEVKIGDALKAVGELCGKCDESHDDACFVNQARRSLIAARTGIDLGLAFDGKKSLEELLNEAFRRAQSQRVTPTPIQTAEVQIEKLDKGQRDFARLEVKYEDLKEKDIFRSTLIDEIMITIGRVSKGDFAAEMPVHDDEQLGKLATAFNLMLKTVNATMKNLDRLVAERSAEMRMIMNTVPVGLLSINEEYRINPEYSKTCETILGIDQLRGRDFLDVLGLTRRYEKEREDLTTFLELLIQKALPEEDMAPLNPFQELKMPEPSGRWARLGYHLIERGLEKPHLLVVIEDITRAKALQEEIAKSNKENIQLRAIAEDPDLFCEFLREALKVLDQAQKLAGDIALAADPRPLVNEVFRGVHTIKGTAASFSLENIASLASELENHLSGLRTALIFPPDEVVAAQEALANLSGAVQEVAASTQRLLGQDISGDGRIWVRLPAEEISRIRDVVQASTLESGLKKAIVDDLARLRSVSARKGLARSLKVVTGLAERLGKEARFVLQGGEVRIDVQVANELNGPLIHLIRNAFDHGLEDPDERVEAGKPEEGQVILSISATPQGLFLSLTDDGRGLVPVRLKSTAIKKGLIDQEEADRLSADEALALIFRPGFSTSTDITDVSGRGVGMDAVLTTIEQILKGRVTLVSTAGQGTTIKISIPR